ncbi:hypothetical protein Tco_0215400 [Tanacetum coccineum]
MVINSPCLTDKKELAIPGQTTTGNGYKWQSQAPRHHGGNPAQTSKESINWKDIESQASLTQEGEHTGKWSLQMMIWMIEGWPQSREELKTKTKPMFKESDFKELHDDMQDVQEETVDATTFGVSTVSTPVTTAGVTISNAEPRTPTSTTTIFDDEDVTMAMARALIKMKEQKDKEKGVAITDVEDSSQTIRPVRSIITLKPLPNIDPKDKGKGVLVEEEPMKIKRRDQGLAQVERDAELAQRIHEEELAELESIQREREEQEKASIAALYNEYDDIQASIDVDALFAVKLQQEEREQFTIKERAKFLVETIEAHRKFRAA